MPSSSGDWRDIPLWRTLYPFAVAIPLMAFVLSRIDWGAFFQHLGRVHYLWFFVFLSASITVGLAADALATVHIYRRKVPGLKYGQFIIVRGASYLPSLLSHHLGHAWITYFIARTYGVGLGSMASATLLVYATWGGCILGLACVVFLASGQPLSWVIPILGLGALYLMLLVIKPAWLARNRVLGLLFEAGVGGHLMAMVFRVPHLITVFFANWAFFLLFHIDIPWLDALTYIPLIMVVVNLPISSHGLGTRDALAAAFFERFVSAPTHAERLAAVAACTTSIVVTMVLVECLVGLFFLYFATRLGLQLRATPRASSRVHQ